MTAIVKRQEEKPPAHVWAGILAPGLGHLLQAKFIQGAGLLVLFGLWGSVLVAAKVNVVVSAVPMIGLFALGGLLLLTLPAIVTHSLVSVLAGEAPSPRRSFTTTLTSNLLQLVVAVCFGALAILVLDRLDVVVSLLFAIPSSGLLSALVAAFRKHTTLRNLAAVFTAVTGLLATLLKVYAASEGASVGLALGCLLLLFLTAGSALLMTFTLQVSARAGVLVAACVQASVLAILAGLSYLSGILPFTVPLLDTIHPTVAVYGWLALTGVLWWQAYREANPIFLTDEERNSSKQLFLRTFKKNRTGMIGLFGVGFLLGITVLTPLLAPFDPDLIDVGAKNLPPSSQFWMGTDEFGRDLFSRVLYGGRISLSIGFIAVSIAATIGTTVGAVAGYAGGWVDRILMFLVDMLLSLPRLVLLLAIVGIFRPKGVFGIFLIVAILGLTAWMGISRIVRSQVLSLKQQDFVQAARALGMSPARIVFRHLIPNALAPVIVYCSLAIGGTILAEAGLSFLGLGVPPPTSTWGTLVNDGRDPLRIAPWIATFPGLMIVAAVMCFNLLGDGLRDALDPKLRGSG